MGVGVTEDRADAEAVARGEEVGAVEVGVAVGEALVGAAAVLAADAAPPAEHAASSTGRAAVSRTRRRRARTTGRLGSGISARYAEAVNVG